MPTRYDHVQATYKPCRRCDTGTMFWGPADGPAAVLGLEGTCCHCGQLDYTGDILSGAQVAQPKPPSPQRRGGSRLRSGRTGRRTGWRSNDSLFLGKAS